MIFSRGKKRKSSSLFAITTTLRSLVMCSIFFVVFTSSQFLTEEETTDFLFFALLLLPRTFHILKRFLRPSSLLAHNGSHHQAWFKVVSGCETQFFLGPEAQFVSSFFSLAAASKSKHQTRKEIIFSSPSS